MTIIKDSVVLITGATNGIGKATAYALARKGAKVIVHGRDKGRITETVNEIREKTGNSCVEGILCDLKSLKTVRNMAVEFKARYDRLDVLINNAGGIFLNDEKSEDGIEITFAVNFLSHFLLTKLLLDLLKKSAPSRIITVSSSAHRYLKRLDIGKVAAVNGYGRILAYSASKICENLFAFELAERLKGSGVTSNALHPGAVRTGFGLNSKYHLIRAFMHFGGLFLLSPEEGSETSVYLASSGEVKDVTGKYFDRCKPAPYAENSGDVEEGRKLWELSENLVKRFVQ